MAAGLANAVTGAAFAAQIGASAYDRKYHQNDLEWNELNFFMQIRQLQGDIVDRVREQIYDIYEKKQRSLETNLLVATLMLGIGFGFTVEGTFPNDVESQWVARYFYVVASAFGLVLPFLSMAGFLECRRRLNKWMTYFNGYIFQEVDYEHKTAVAYLPNQRKMRERARGMTDNLPQKEMVPSVHRTLKDFLDRMQGKPKKTKKTKPKPQESEADVLEARAGAAKASKQSLEAFSQEHLKHIHRAAIYLLGVGTASNILCASLLLGMYFQSVYPDTPKLWMVYSGIVGSGLLVWFVLQCVWLSSQFTVPPELEPVEYWYEQEVLVSEPTQSELAASSTELPQRDALSEPLLEQTSPEQMVSTK